MKGLTERQQAILDVIRDSISVRGYPPTLREIGEKMGIRSTNGVSDHLRALERKGVITREDMKSRSIRLSDLTSLQYSSVDEYMKQHNVSIEGLEQDATRGAPDVLKVQVVSAILAGKELISEEYVIDTIQIDRQLLRGARTALGFKMNGNAMVDAGILSGDYILVREQHTANRGDVVLALVGDEAIVRFYFPEKDYVRFQPANKGKAPILVRSSDFRPSMLLGQAIGLHRRL